MIEGKLKLLIVGGYGMFGGRLALLLARDPRFSLIIGGRSLERAKLFIDTLPKRAEVSALVIDRDGDLEGLLKQFAPDTVVDATGPFQAYGQDPYRLVRATIAAGANYLDLADGSDFVEGIGAFNEEAREKNVFVLSGVSSFPVLTAAVVRAAASHFDAIDSVTGGIAPSPYAGVGLNVIRAITHYAGQPIRLYRDGELTTAHALTESRRYTIAPPGRLPLNNTRFSLVDVPDLVLIPREIPSIGSMWMGAGPVPEFLHRLLNLLAQLVRLGLLPTLAPLAPLAFWAINTFRWGEHRGGMFVEISGKGPEGNAVRRSWHLLAEGSDGPLIPSMAIAAIALKMLDGMVPPPGARPATAARELMDYDRVFAGRTISWGWRDDGAPARGLYQELLGRAWEVLPLAVRQLHEFDGELTVHGLAEIENGAGLLARLVRRLVGFPEAGRDVPVSVTFKLRDGIETWTRRFGTESFSSTQQRGRGRSERLLVERFGPLAVSLALIVSGGQLQLVVRRWSCLGIPLPHFLAPRSNSFEFEQDGRFNFHVELHHPLTGPIVSYMGWLEREAPAPE